MRLDANANDDVGILKRENEMRWMENGKRVNRSKSRGRIEQMLFFKPLFYKFTLIYAI